MSADTNKQGMIYASFDAEWLNTPSPFQQLDNDWIKIIIFYVFHIPVSGISARGGSLSAYQWGEMSKKNDFKLLKKKLIFDAQIEDKHFRCVEKKEEMEKALTENDLINFPLNITAQRITFKKHKSGMNESLLSHIRNSFAHGRLAFYMEGGETYVAMEDIGSQGLVTARMILSKSTLMKWKQTIENGPYIARAVINNDKKEIKS
mgnify:CR=1 FL=1